MSRACKRMKKGPSGSLRCAEYGYAEASVTPSGPPYEAYPNFYDAKKHLIAARISIFDGMKAAEEMDQPISPRAKRIYNRMTEKLDDIIDEINELL